MPTISPQEFANLLPDSNLLASDEPEMESSLHYLQAMLLVSCLEWLWRDRDDFFIGANLTVYFSRQQLKNRDFRGPDFFLVKNTQRQPRRSWVVWEEDGKYPDIIIELLSESTAEVDRTTKRELYQDRFRTPEYFWFDPESLEFVGLRLIGNRYQDIPNQPQGKWSETLELYLTILDGQLRFFKPNGELVPTPQESAVREGEAAAQARQESAMAKQDSTLAREESVIAKQESALAQEESVIAKQESALAQEESANAKQESANAKQEAANAKQEAANAKQEAAIAKQEAEQLKAKLRELGVDLG
jgi:Uma2 family endonuclease